MFSLGSHLDQRNGITCVNLVESTKGGGHSCEIVLKFRPVVMEDMLLKYFLFLALVAI